jgi:peptidoglycan/LPS O-acetylase OafA/YrhL
MALESGAARSPLRYRPELDGVRAVAVLIVVWHHLGILDVPRLGAGFLGVDVFFVLSGYLITTLLLIEQRRCGDVRLGDFYVRRALRLLPALFLMLLVAGIAVYASGLDAEIDKYRGSLPWVLAYLANWRLTDLGLLGHTWSLAIEEQFYVTWPFALVLLTRRRVDRRVVAAGLLVAALGLAVLSAGWGAVPPLGLSRRGLVIVSTYARAVPILLGCAIALVPEYAVRARERLVGIAGIAGALIVFVIRRDPSTFHFKVGYVAFALFVAAALAHVVHAPDGAIARALVNRPLVAIGRVSYGIYLFHVPVILFLSWESPVPLGIASGVVAIAATAALTVWSWFVVERPALAYQARFRRGGGRAQITPESTAE